MMQMPQTTHSILRIIYTMKTEGGATAEARHTSESTHTGGLTSSDVSMQSPVSKRRWICQSELN